MSLEMAKVNKGGLMALSTKVSGASGKQMGKASCTMPTVTFMKENGLRIKPMVEAFILMQMAQNMSAIGKTTNSMALGLRRGLMAQFMKVNIKKERSMGLEN